MGTHIDRATAEIIANEIGAGELMSFGSDTGRGPRYILNSEMHTFHDTAEAIAYLYGVAEGTNRSERLSATSMEAVHKAMAALDESERGDTYERGLRGATSKNVLNKLAP